MSYNDNLRITGPSFALSYKRTTYKPLDASSVFDTYKDAVTYANNMLADYQFVPYPGQVISVVNDPTESNNNVYKLVRDVTLTLGDGDTRNHCRLEKIGGIGELKETFTLRDNEEKIEKIWEFLAGLRVLGVLNADDVKAVTVTVDKGEENPQPGGKTYVQSGGYIRGGKGFGIYKDANGSWCLDIDNVQVRGSLGVNELKVSQTEYLGGEVILTVGGSIEATAVEETAAGGYKVYFRNKDDDGREIYCQMAVGDLAKHQTYNEKTGSRLYWLKVDEVGGDYVVLSRLEGDTTPYSTPRAGDEIVHLGNVSDKTRQSALIFSARTQSMRIYTGIDTTSLGNAEAPIDLNPVESRILAKFITMSTGVSLDTAFTDVRDRMGVLADDVDTLKNQSDKQFIIWFADYTPTLNNEPYTDWIADGKDERELHIKDVFYNTNSSVNAGGGRAFRFEKDPAGNYCWTEITDKDTLLALEKAAKAQDTADGKRRVFVMNAGEVPEPPYDEGDMWTNATYKNSTVSYSNDTLVVKKGCSRSAGESFRISDWQPASTATTAYLTQLADQILMFATNANNAISDIRGTITDIQGKLQTAQDTAAQAALDAARGIGLANAAQEAADSAMAALQVTSKNITALVEGGYLNADGTIRQTVQGILDVAQGYVTALSQKLTFDNKGLVTNIDRSGLVLTSQFASLFTEQVDKNGIAKRAEIATSVADGISKAVIRADQVEISGTVRINSYFEVDEKGHLVIGRKDAAGEYDVNALTVYGSGSFSGTVNATGGVFSNIHSPKKTANGEYYFSIDQDGKLTVNEAVVRGTVYATGGVFSNVKSKNGTWMIDEEGNFKATSGEFSGDLSAQTLNLAICDSEMNGSLALANYEYILPALEKDMSRVIVLVSPLVTRTVQAVHFSAADGAAILPDSRYTDCTNEISFYFSGVMQIIGVNQELAGVRRTYWYLPGITKSE